MIWDTIVAIGKVLVPFLLMAAIALAWAVAEHERREELRKLPWTVAGRLP